MKFIVRSTYDSDYNYDVLRFLFGYHKLIHEHYLRRSYDFASESYLKSLAPGTS